MREDNSLMSVIMDLEFKDGKLLKEQEFSFSPLSPQDDISKFERLTSLIDSLTDFLRETGVTHITIKDLVFEGDRIEDLINERLPLNPEYSFERLK